MHCWVKDMRERAEDRPSFHWSVGCQAAKARLASVATQNTWGVDLHGSNKKSLWACTVLQLDKQMSVLGSKPCQTPEGKTRSRFINTKERSNSFLRDRTRACLPVCQPRTTNVTYSWAIHVMVTRKYINLKYIVDAYMPTPTPYFTARLAIGNILYSIV
jgi:hypothetical protein